MLESAGRPDARASDDLRSAAGLTQILAETGQNLLGMHIDVKASERLTRGILRGHRVQAREAARRRVDERFDPAKAIEATARYLDFAKGKLGRDDLAVVSLPHGHRQPAAGADGLRQGRRPLRAAVLRLHAPAPRRGVAQAGVAAATTPRPTCGACSRPARSCACTATIPQALQREAVLQSAQGLGRGGPAPAPSARRSSATPSRSGARGRRRAARRSTGSVLAPYGLQHGPEHGRARGGAIKQSPRLYRALRPQALAMLQALGAGDARDLGQPAADRHEHGARQATTSACWPRPNSEATHAYSLHTTGYAFDIARGYRSRAQALAFQFVLDRLTARGHDRLGARAPGDPHHRRVALGRQRAEQLAGGLRDVLRRDPELLQDLGPGAEAPKRSIAPRGRPSAPSPCETPASTETVGSPGGSTTSR